MKDPILTALRYLAAMLAGYGLIAIGTTLTFEVWLGGIGYHTSTAKTLVLATLGALASGVLGGYVAAWIGAQRPIRHAAAVLVLLLIDTFYVVTSGISSDPLAFDLAASGGLMAAALLGGWLRRRWRRRATTAMAAI